MMHAMADKPDQQVVVLCQVSDYTPFSLSAFMRVGDQAMCGKALFFKTASDTLVCDSLGSCMYSKVGFADQQGLALC